MRVDRLLPTDLDLHQRLGIDSDVLVEAGVQRVSTAEAKDLGIVWRGDLSGVAYPRRDPRSGNRVTVRVRRDHPDVVDGKVQRKYLSPSGDRARLYFPVVGTEALRNTEVPAIFVEAEKSALMLIAVARRRHRPLYPIATGGCWGWRGRTGKTEAPDGSRVDQRGPLADLDLVEWQGRVAIIWFDANASHNPDVAKAREELAYELTKRGARVMVVDTPAEPGVNGPDDYRGRHDDAAVLALLDGARDGAVCRTPTEYIAATGLGDIPMNASPEAVLPSLKLLAVLLQRERRPLERQAVRQMAVIALTTKRVSGAAAMVDAALKTDATVTAEAAAVWMTDETPSDDRVDLAALLDETALLIRSHVVMPGPECADAVALWVASAWSHAATSILALLCFTSPTKRCGKSTAMTVVSAVSPRPLLASNITPSALFRAVNEWQPTLFIDEADTFLPNNFEMKGIINSGHLRHTAQVIRCAGDDHQPTVFSTWSPKVIGMIGHPFDTIVDRSIVIQLQRKGPDARIQRVRQDQIRERCAELRAKYRRWADDDTDALRGADPYLPQGLNDRAGDNWRHLVAIADLAAGDWPTRARKAALAVSGAEDEGDQPLNVLLLSDIDEIWPNERRAAEGWWPSRDLINGLIALENRPWTTIQQGRPLTGAKLARMLRDFKVKPAKERQGDHTYNAYRWRPLDVAIDRYAPRLSGTAEHANDSGSQRPSEDGTEGAVRSVTNPKNEPENTGVFHRSASTVPATGVLGADDDFFEVP